MQVPADQLLETCGQDPSWVCQQVLEASDGNEFLARTVDFLLAKPLQILLILVVAAVVNRLVRRAIRDFANGLADGRRSEFLRTLRGRAPAVLATAPDGAQRAIARATTIAGVLRSVASGVVYGIALLLVLGEIGIDLGPLLAGAGIAGIAVGFGAQSLVRDFLSGIFVLVEDQYGVGDVIDAGEASGVVEAVTLRATRLRDVEGTLWHVPNGAITRVGNKSQQWSRALLDVSVATGTDLRRAEAVIKEVADALWHDEAFAGAVLEEPEVWGVERLGADAIDIRVVLKTRPAEQWKVLRELRGRLKDAFDAAGIELPSQRALWLRTDAATPDDDRGANPT